MRGGSVEDIESIEIYLTFYIYDIYDRIVFYDTYSDDKTFAYVVKRPPVPF